RQRDEAAFEELVRRHEALADGQFTERQMTVTGGVLRVRRNGQGYALLIEAGGTVPLLFEFGPDARKELAKLKRRQLVTVQGRCRGREKGESGQEAIVFSKGRIAWSQD